MLLFERYALAAMELNPLMWVFPNLMVSYNDQVRSPHTAQRCFYRHPGCNLPWHATGTIGRSRFGHEIDYRRRSSAK